MDAADVDADDMDMDDLAHAELAGGDGGDALGPRAQVGLGCAPKAQAAGGTAPASHTRPGCAGLQAWQHVVRQAGALAPAGPAGVARLSARAGGCMAGLLGRLATVGAQPQLCRRPARRRRSS